MANKLKSKEKKSDSSVWLTVLKAILYAVMLLLVLMFFEGNGQFLYEI